MGVLFSGRALVCEDLLHEGGPCLWVGGSSRNLQLVGEPHLASAFAAHHGLLCVLGGGSYSIDPSRNTNWRPQRGRDSSQDTCALTVHHADPPSPSPCYPDPDTAAQDPGPGSGRRSAGARGAEPAAHVPDYGGGGCAAGTHVLAHLPPCTVSCRPGLQLPHSSRLTRAPALQARALPPSQGALVASCTPATINLMGSARPPPLPGRGRRGAERAASLIS